MYASERHMGPVPWIDLRYQWNFSGLNFQRLSIESHVRFWDTYGTSPMLWSQTAMGLIPWIFSCYQWDFTWPFSMYGSESFMGPVPCIDLRYLWDWSHRLLCNMNGTSYDLIFNVYLLIPMCSLRYLWDRSHVWIFESYGTDPKINFETAMGLLGIWKILLI